MIGLQRSGRRLGSGGAFPLWARSCLVFSVSRSFACRLLSCASTAHHPQQTAPVFALFLFLFCCRIYLYQFVCFIFWLQFVVLGFTRSINSCTEGPGIGDKEP
ncbi:uncharacterized protein BJX67DRAFT_361237 [Aspergillus lucknowensis]|uniref:Uncharacterized protein n=1 Tax=Aspergillus lucknowensis TaxID=176173 RepID=A0ABR4LIU7_9EURO